jgi:hypothetical protein
MESEKRGPATEGMQKTRCKNEMKKAAATPCHKKDRTAKGVAKPPAKRLAI